MSSPTDAAPYLIRLRNLMHEHLPDGTQIHYVITHGGQAAEGAALGTGTTMEYELIHGNYERLINLTLAKLMLDNLKKVGGLDLNEREKAFVREVLANSDFEDREAELNNMLTVRPDLGPVDSIGGTTIGTKSLLNVAKVFYLTAVELYTDPSKVRAIRGRNSSR